jgi:hypothetical protein
MTTTNPVVLSGNRLRAEALVFIGENRKAAQLFGVGVQKATRAYVGRVKASGERFAQSAAGSANRLGSALQKEAGYWQALVIKTRDAYTQTLRDRTGALESGVTEAREALRPDSVRVRALKTAHELLETAQTAVDAQLASASEEETKTPAPKAAPPKRTPRKATPASRKTDGAAPIRNYDKLTAKDVVARIQRLTPTQASALLDYEQGRKNRATVIRAAKQRAAAS